MRLLGLLALIGLFRAEPSFTYAAVCQIQGHVPSSLGAASVVAYGKREFKEYVIRSAKPEKDGTYKLFFGGTQRGSFTSVLVRALDEKRKTLAEKPVPNERDKKTIECENTLDF
jgi:hypothetical protein